MVIQSYTYHARPWSLNAERKGATHWSETSARTAEWRQAYWALGLSSGKRFTGPVVVEVEVAMRHPLADTAACVGAVKAAIDGLVDAKVIPGDTGDVVRSITFHAPSVAPKGVAERMTITVADL